MKDPKEKKPSNAIKPVKFTKGAAKRNVPVISPEIIAGLQSTNAATRANAILAVAETFMPQVPKTVLIPKREAGYVRNAVLDVFENRGGVSAYGEWADENPTEYYRQFVSMEKTLSSSTPHATQINIVSNIPKSGLDEKTTQTFTIVEEVPNEEPDYPEDFE